MYILTFIIATLWEQVYRPYPIISSQTLFSHSIYTVDVFALNKKKYIESNLKKAHNFHPSDLLILAVNQYLDD